MATDGVLRGLGIMRPFLIANMVNLAIRLSVALIFAPRFGIAFVWLAVPAGWFVQTFDFLRGRLGKSWPKCTEGRGRQGIGMTEKTCAAYENGPFCSIALADIPRTTAGRRV